MSIFDKIVSFFTNMFGGDDGDDDDEGLLTGDYHDDGEAETGSNDDLPEYTEDEEAYIMSEGEGELVNHPPVDLESGLAYCSEAPDGILHLVRIGDDEYEIWRTDSAE